MSTIVPLFVFLAVCVWIVCAACMSMAQTSVVGSGLPSGRAGLDQLFKHLKVTGNVSGATAGSNITVTGIDVGDVLLGVQVGDGTDIAGAITITAANTIQIATTSTASKKLNVWWIDTSALSGQQSIGTEYDAYYGILDTLFGVKLACKTVAGANGAVTVTGIATTDILLAVWETTAVVDCDGSTWAVTANTITPTATVDTSSKIVGVLYIDVSVTSAGNGIDLNTSLPPEMDAGALNRFIKGLRISVGTGTNGAGSITAGTYADIATTDNILAVFNLTSATDPLDGAWTAAAGGAAYAGSENFSSAKIMTIWTDTSVIDAAA